MKSIMVVKCVTSGAGFVAGEIYPVVGDNNGIQIARTNEEHDGSIDIFQTGGIGNGLFNAWDDSGRPSFVLFAMLRNERLAEEVDAVLGDYPVESFEPVIKCRDCKHWKTPLAFTATGKCEQSGTITNKNFFCGGGKRESLVLRSTETP